MALHHASPIGPLIGAIDEGTSSARFFLFKAKTGHVVAWHQREIHSILPKEGWLEQDPLDILQAVDECIEETIKKLRHVGGSVDDIVGVGVTNQRESTLVWNKESGQPLHNLLVWRDMRTTTTVEELLNKVPNYSRDINYLKPLCGLPLSPYFSAVKLRWLQENVPAVDKAIGQHVCLFGTVDTWLIWHLTGVHVTDVTNASRTMLMNIETLQWDATLLDFFEVQAEVLPIIKSSSEVYGWISKGPLKGIPIAGCLGDQQAALIGQQCLQNGEAKATYGTGCFLLYNTGLVKVDSVHGLLTTVAYQLGPEKPPVYALEGSVAAGGAALAWLRNNIELFSDYAEIEDMAKLAEEEEGGEVSFVPAFSGLYAPYWQHDARGVICGIAEDTQACHIVKAALDAVCFQIRDIIEAMNKDYGSALTQLRVDGGMTANSFLMQLQANLTGTTIIRPDMSESTALGAAMVAGAAVGYWDLDHPLTLATTQWQSKISDWQRDIKYNKWKMAVERAGGWEQ